MKARIASNRLLGLALLVSAIAGSSARGQTQTLLPSANTEAQTPTAPELSSGLADLLELARSGVDESRLLLRMNTTTDVFGLRADQIIYLQKLGVSSRLIIAMLQHDADLLSGRRPADPFPPIESKGLVMSAAVADKDPFASLSKQTNSVPNQSSAPASPPINSSSSPNEYGSATVELAEPDWPSDSDDAVPEQEPELYPVRKPYPVKLSDPIIVFKMPVLTPNLVVIQPLP